jgi:hypothetical protein
MQITSSTEYLLLESLIYLEERANEDRRRELKRSEEKIAVLRCTADRFKDKICTKCGGHGYVRVWYAQDDCKSEKCEQCDGTGLKKNASA